MWLDPPTRVPEMSNDQIFGVDPNRFLFSGSEEFGRGRTKEELRMGDPVQLCDMDGGEESLR